MLAGLFILAAVIFVAAYYSYGTWMGRVYGLDNSRKTPSEEFYDGIDYCPAHPAVLVGHHFASIAGAGPIVGPITAAAWFGWLPVYLWCVLGSVFLGGPHDMGALAASIRHRGLSVGEVVDQWIGRRGKRLFLCFSWLALILVVAVFLQLSADTFASDPAVAFSGTFYLVLAMIFGVLVYRYHFSLLAISAVMVPLVVGAVWLGTSWDWVQTDFRLSMETWRLILIGYILFASVLPVWLLLQPRDYLASFLLYFSVIIGTIGMLAGGHRFEINLPAYISFHPEPDRYLWPILFVTVACGAISGFHCMVGSGTTSKQLRRESDALVIGYGAMLVEGLVAVIALGTIMMAGTLPKEGPLFVFGHGFGRFAELIGIEHKVGMSLGLLAINTFILTTLDTATRLARYQLQELSNMRLDRFTATIAGVLASAGLLYVRSGDMPAWKILWPLFGASNQLVAALALLGVLVWVVKGLGKNGAFLRYPMYFMLATTLAALVLFIKTNLAQANYVMAAIAGLLVVLAVWLTVEAYFALRKQPEA
jgi:carbon starvation protein